MIYGNGVGSKYHAIISARSKELLTGKTGDDRIVASEMLDQFRDQVQHCKPSQFDEWYELYKDYVYVKPNK